MCTCDTTPLGGGLAEGSTLVDMGIRVDVITFNVKCPVKPWIVVPLTHLDLLGHSAVAKSRAFLKLGRHAILHSN